jgi:lysophospholipase L1-like esterase
MKHPGLFELARVMAARPAVVVLCALGAWACDEHPTSATAGLFMSCPAPVTVSPAGSGVTLSYQIPTATGGRAPVTVNCTPPPGASLTAAPATIACTATDAEGRTTSCHSFVSASGGQTIGATRYLAFGNSMTAGEITGTGLVGASSYPAQLADRLRARYPTQASEIAVANAGQPGELALDALPRLAELLANSQTQALLLLHGSTDLLNHGAGAVSPSSAAINDLAHEGRRRGARVFIGLLPPPVPGRQRSVPDDVVRAFNDRLRAVAAGEGAVVVDVYAALAGDVNRYIGPDGHHPTAAGYQRIADEFLTAIRAEFER